MDRDTALRLTTRKNGVGKMMTWKYLRSYLAENRITYQQYLESDHWNNLRARFWASKMHRGECWVCGGSRGRLEVHHRSYRRIGKERLNDLIPLCRDCHEKTHEIDRTRKKGCLWGAAKRLRKDRIKRGEPVGWAFR